MTNEEKLNMLDTSKMGVRTTFGAVMDYDAESLEITVKLYAEDFEKLDPENVAIVQLNW